jgi:hypothetical protein
MRTFGQFIKSSHLEDKIASLIITTNHTIIQDSLREVFEKYIAESEDKASIINLYNNASLFLETEVASPPRTGPAQNYADPTDLSGYIGKLADSVVSHAKKTLGTDKISSHFLSELLNAIVQRTGKNIVDPERGGQAFRFQSTHTQNPDEVETLNKKWENIPERYKAHYLFNLAKYYFKYLQDADQAFDRVRKSIDPQSLNNTQKGNFTRALKQARQWWDSQEQNSRNIPMSPYKEPTTKPEISRTKKDSIEPEGEGKPPEMPSEPTEKDIDKVLDWYFNPNGHNKQYIKNQNGEPTIKFAGSYLSRKTIKDILMKRYNAKPTKTINGPEDIDDITNGLTNRQGKIKVQGQSMSPEDLKRRLAGEKQPQHNVSSADDVTRSLAGIDDDAMLDNPFGGGKIKKKDLEQMMRHWYNK